MAPLLPLHLLKLLCVGLWWWPLLCLAAIPTNISRGDGAGSIYGPASGDDDRSAEGEGGSGRHIRAALQSRKVANVTISPVSPYNETGVVSRSSPREPLARYGEGIVYMLELAIGTPGQVVSAILDTGSYTLLLDPTCDRAADPTACRTYGYYDTSQSSTAQSLDGWFAGKFGTGYMQGVWYSDTAYVGMDNLPLPSLRVGVSKLSEYVWAGVLGVSYGNAWNTGYKTLLDLLVAQGYIEVPIFSLGVGYQGGGSPRITPPGQNETVLTESKFERNVLIDSGSTYTYLSADMVAAIAKALYAYLDPHGVWIVPCESRNLDGSVNFGFNFYNIVIRVNYADFIVDFDSYCALGVQITDDKDSTWVLGTSFIRAAYLVFDQQNDAVWIAQYFPCGESVTDLTTDAGRQLWLEVTGLC
ncbi:acid protease [Hypoxylon fragiforme]|uniref:acid protease n=1 Tax=Hypoxylon fragiforme TaxID=63214 RepID=UPI0020C72131|nr:acid protease [Hypoxylon fragiforme]KAI2610813.1 acid protease [Hypoxylon fragiforme]